MKSTIAVAFLLAWLLPPDAEAQGRPSSKEQEATEDSEEASAPTSAIPDFLLGEWRTEIVTQDPEDPETQLIQEMTYVFLPSGQFTSQSKTRVKTKEGTADLEADMESSGSGTFSVEDVSERGFRMKSCHGRECAFKRSERIQRVDENTIQDSSGVTLRRTGRGK